MKFIYKTLKDNAIQITTSDERWYAKTNEKGEPISFIPSVTWICSHYPKGISFYKWLANHGWDESQSLKETAANKGSKIHQAIEKMLKENKVIKYNDKFINHEKETEEELTFEEYEAVLSFVEWYQEVKPKILYCEKNLIGEKFAGTLDLVCEINNEKWIIDFKTGQNLWPEYEIQLSGYNLLLGENYKLGILQIGYKKNKYKKFKFTEIKHQADLFRAAYTIWQKESSNQKPLQKDYPLAIGLDIDLKQFLNVKKQCKIQNNS